MLLRYGMFSLCLDGKIASAATRCLVRSILGPTPSNSFWGMHKRLSHQLSRSSRAPLSFVEEIQELRRTAGKPFSAEKLADSQTFKFPEMRAINLDGVDITLPSFFQKRVTLIAISMRQIGAEKLSSWISPLAVRTCSSSRAKNHTKIVQLSVVENPVARLFQSWFLSNLRRLETDPLLHHTTILRIGDSTDQRRVLGMSNRLVGKPAGLTQTYRRPHRRLRLFGRPYRPSSFSSMRRGN